MTDKNPVFRVVKDADAPVHGDLPYLQLIPDSASSETENNSKQTASRPRPAISVVQKSTGSSDTNHFQASAEQPGSFAQSTAQGSFVGYPPLPALVTGLFLLVFMLLGD